MRLIDLLQSKQDSASRLLATGNPEGLPVSAQLGYALELPVRAGHVWTLGFVLSRGHPPGAAEKEVSLGAI